MTRIGSIGAIVLVLAFAVACDGDGGVDGPPLVGNLPAGSGDFLGYSAPATKTTTCGNCHVGKQQSWEQTEHAHAWEGLQSSSAAQEMCEACHSVSSRGNVAVDEDVGWVSTHNARYQDVQCESCHGPGLAHVTNPDANNTKPLASLAVGLELDYGCGECHSGTHRPFAEEWSESRHARVIESRASLEECAGCHEAKAILKGWGVQSTFMEEDQATNYLAVTCAVCHNPHDATHEGQLRYAMDVADEEQNLCMKCHHKRGRPDMAAQQRGPHSPEGPLLLGQAGWVPPSFDEPEAALVGSHGSGRNPRLCATCHVNDYTMNDPLTGTFSFRATGHSFQAIPCVDASGVPNGLTDCTLAERSFRACVACHLEESAARSAYTVAEMRIERLADEVEAALAQVPSTEFNASDPVYTTAEGSRFNMLLARNPGSFVHNPFLVEALLLASLEQLELDYGVTPSAGLVMEAQLRSH